MDGLIYTRSEDDELEREDTSWRRATLGDGKPSLIPFTTSPQSSPSNALLNPLAHITFVQRNQ